VSYELDNNQKTFGNQSTRSWAKNATDIHQMTTEENPQNNL